VITLASALEPLEKACGLFPASGTQIYGYYARYGNGYPFTTTWLCQEEDGTVWGALGKYNGALRLSCGTLTVEQVQELRDFIGMTGSGCVTLEASEAAVHTLFPQGAYSCGEVMEYRGDAPEYTDERINTSPKPDDVFPILKESDPIFAQTAQFDEWLCDAFHLCNHGGGWYAVIGREAVAAITALTPAYGLIGSVATIPSARGKGYATMLTQCCVHRLCSSGRIPVLLAADARAAGLYRRIGFETTDRWAVINMI